MTNDDTTTHDQHLDDETLSAHSDGEETRLDQASIEAHLDSCAECTARRDELDSAARLIGSEVAALSDETRAELVAQALATPQDAPVELSPMTGGPARRRPGSGSGAVSTANQMVFRAAAVVAILALVAAGAYGAARLVAGSRGSSSASTGQTQSPSAAGTTTTSPAHTAPTPGAPVQLRVAKTAAGAGCSATMDPPAEGEVVLPDVVDTTLQKPACLLLSPAIGSISGHATVAISNGSSTSGPETLTITVPSPVSRSLAGARSALKFAVPPNPRLVVVADGAVVGYVIGVGPLASNGTRKVVLNEIDPAVGAYIAVVLKSS